MSITTFKDITEISSSRLADCPLGKSTEDKTFDKPLGEYDRPLAFQIVENKRDGIMREETVGAELKQQYPESEGFQVIREAYLRDLDGKILKDIETGEARRIDFVVVQDGKVIESIEVTSLYAPKLDQCAKEARIRENGGNYFKLNDGNLAECPCEIITKIERRA